MRVDESISDLQEEEMDVANKFQGKRPIKRNTEYGIFWADLVGIRRIMEKAKLMTSI